MAKSNKQKQSDFVSRQKELERSGRKYWATNSEHEHLTKELMKIRSKP